MASFVIHDVAGEVFLKELKEKYGIELSDIDTNKFLMGNLIVDSSKYKLVIPDNLSDEELKKIKLAHRKIVQQEKISTHFRGLDDLDKCIQAPIPDKFVEKYNYLFDKDISVLAYLFHLYTDKVFFNDLSIKSFKCLDDKYNETKYISDLKYMQTLKDNKIHDFKEFWSPDGIYSDYTKMNKLFLEKYNIKFDSNALLSSTKYFINPGIEEVDYNNVSSVINKTSKFISDSYNLDNTDLKIFDIEIVNEFISFVVSSFMETYSEIIEKSLNNNVKINKLVK